MVVSFRQFVLYSICFTVLLCAFNAQASKEKYLKMLESEAEDLKLDQRGQLKDKQKISDNEPEITKKNWSWEGDLEGDTLPPGLAQDEFAALLKQHFYGTFVFYRRLNTNDQNTVYYQYKKASPAELEPIRQNILNLLRQ